MGAGRCAPIGNQVAGLEPDPESPAAVIVQGDTPPASMPPLRPALAIGPGRHRSEFRLPYRESRIVREGLLSDSKSTVQAGYTFQATYILTG